MLQYLPSGCGLYNVRKMSVLQCLAYREMGGYPWSSAGDIATLLEMTPGQRESLYVLLGRWTTWKLVRRRHKATYRNWRRAEDPSGKWEYSITQRGHKWLTRLPRTELRNRIPPRRLPLVVAELLDLSVWWGWSRPRPDIGGRVRFDRVLFIRAPFTKPEHFVEIENHRLLPGQPLRIRGCHSLIQADNAYAAWGEVSKVLGLEVGRELVDKIVSANVGLAWKSDDKAG